VEFEYLLAGDKLPRETGYPMKCVNHNEFFLEFGIHKIQIKSVSIRQIMYTN